ncbi:unnamed protein product [Arabidopsis halleri]
MTQALFGDYDVGVLLDSENSRFTNNMDNIVWNIETSLHRIDDRYRIYQRTRVYSGNINTYYTNQHTYEQGEAPTNDFERSFDVADSFIIDEMLGRALVGNLPPNVLLISTNRDFIQICKFSIHYRRLQHLSGDEQKSTNDTLHSTPYALATWEWTIMQAGGQPLHQRPQLDRRIRMNT